MTSPATSVLVDDPWRQFLAADRVGYLVLKVS
jgi:hypothetical protein